MSARTARQARANESTSAANGSKPLAPASRWDPRTWLPRLADWGLRAKHATYSFAVFRIIYGLVVLMVLVTNAADRHYIWGVGSQWLDLELGVNPYPAIFGFLFPKDNQFLFDLSYGVLAVLAILFTVGWRTRFVTPFLLLFWVSLSTNSNLVNNGGDTVMRITLLFAVFADLSQRFSVDDWLRKRRAERGLAPARSIRVPWWPSWAGTLLHNTALVLCGYQIALVYVRSATLKLQGPEWVNGTASYYSVILDNFRPFPMLSDLTFQLSFAVYVATFVALYTQLLFPVLLLWRPSRIFALIAISGMHLGIAILLGLWPFSLAMIALDFLFVRDSTWVAAFGWGRRTLGVLKAFRVPGDGSGAGSGSGSGSESEAGAEAEAGAESGAVPTADQPVGASAGVTVGGAGSAVEEPVGEHRDDNDVVSSDGAEPDRSRERHPVGASGAERRRFVHRAQSLDDPPV
ncbi:HTTM domain-containing protein [Plantibacter sp. YIM 135347]|uniref:HTTM domain-containing protein n=1 Tax=Plantibacter sp. YIM 135347 TaxID=3423919 RepID=UPI003D32A7B9